MRNLEQRFFATKQETVISAGNKDAPLICEFLRKCITKGEFILRGGRSTKYSFNFDRLYDRPAQT